MRLRIAKPTVCVCDDILSLPYPARRPASADYAALISRPVSDLSFKEIAHVDVGSWAGESWSEERVPTLRAALQELRSALAQSGSAHIFVELKGPEEAPFGVHLPSGALLTEASAASVC